MDDSLNIAHTEQLPHDIVPEEFAAEVKRLINQLTMLHARVAEVEGEPRFVFDMGMELEVSVMYISDDEADARMKHQGIVFDMQKGPMACYQVFVTPTRKLMNTTISNMLCDGWSYTVYGNGVVMGALNHWECINSNQNTFPMYLDELENLRRTPRFDCDRDWWIEYMRDVNRLSDFAIKEDYENGRLICKRLQYNKTQLEENCRRNKISVTEVLLTAWAMALGEMTCKDRGKTVTFITTTRGRTRKYFESFGNYLVEKALRIDIGPMDTPKEALQKVRHANFVTNRHNLFTEQDLEPYIGDSDRGTCVLFNEDIDHTEWEVDGRHPRIVYEQPAETCEFLMGILWGRPDCYEMEVTYSQPLYREEDVDRFVERFDYWFRELLK